MIKELTVSLSPETAASDEALHKLLSSKLNRKDGRLNEWRVKRRSIDARRNPVRVNLTVICAQGEDLKVPSGYMPVDFRHIKAGAPQVVIVGAGPAGLFAALRAIELGWKPVVLERGKDVESRRADITELNRNGFVSPDSNYCFGEGGAGTFSDGKLFTRSKKRGNVNEILSLLVQHGAQEEILIDSHPHIGSDRLPHVMKNIRQSIIENGGEVRFNTKVSGLLLEMKDGEREAVGVYLEDGSEVKGPVILATGHSARDVYRFLDQQKVEIEAKGLAIGVRLEHPQKLIDAIQYHSPAGRGRWLPAAEYSFVAQVDGRGVYSFCMCPGGVVVPAASSPGESVVNGMSASSRSSIWSNSGMVVELHPGDIPGFSEYGNLEMMALQESLEHKFFESAEKTLMAPAQRMKDFCEGKDSKNLPPSSYIPGLIERRLDKLLPTFIAQRLQKGFANFGKKAKGFLTNEATLIGLESRTSSPVRIPRDKDTLQHIYVKNLYPAGEGAGYAGGIVSAAIDGRRCVDSLCSMESTIPSRNGTENTPHP